MHRWILVSAAIIGATGIMLGAFGAHGLKQATQDNSIIEIFETGARYQVYHAIVLLALGALAFHLPGKFIKWSAICWVIGVILFSGSLYLLAWLKIEGSTMVKAVGPITPLGGLFLIIGWLCILPAVMKRKL